MEKEELKIRENLDFVKKSRKELLSDIKNIRDKCDKGLISEEAYSNFLNKEINGKTRLEWIAYCNKYIESHEQYGQKPREELPKIKELIKSVNFYFLS